MLKQSLIWADTVIYRFRLPYAQVYEGSLIFVRTLVSISAQPEHSKSMCHITECSSITFTLQQQKKYRTKHPHATKKQLLCTLFTSLRQHPTNFVLSCGNTPLILERNTTGVLTGNVNSKSLQCNKKQETAAVLHSMPFNKTRTYSGDSESVSEKKKLILVHRISFYS